MATMKITLTPEMESLVKEQVASGQYHSPEAVVFDGLRLLKERLEMGRPGFMVGSIAELEMKLAEGADSLARGEGIPAAVSYRRVKQQFRKLRKNG